MTLLNVSIIGAVGRGVNGYDWTIRNIFDNLFRLECHLGYPMGKYLKCPVFTQNKYEYIKHIQKHCIPTYMHPFPEAINDKKDFLISDEERQCLRNFVALYKSYGNNK